MVIVISSVTSSGVIKLVREMIRTAASALVARGFAPALLVFVKERA